MSTARPISVAVDLPLRTGDRAFTFDAGAAIDAGVGTGVIVPIGTRLAAGVVLGDAPSRGGLRPIVAAVDGGPMVPADIVDLAQWTADEFISSVGEALSVATPWASMWSRVRVAARIDGEELEAPYRDIVSTLRRRPVTLTRAARLLASAPGAAAVLAERRSLTVVFGADTSTNTVSVTHLDGPPGLGSTRSPGSSSRSAARWSGALAASTTQGARSVVLAGWDRTAAYREAIVDALRRGWSCIASCATVDAAVSLAAALRGTGLAPALLHGDQRPQVRLSGWRRLIGQQGALVVGTRSAIFAPVAGPVLTIVDDLDHSGHKEERAPRFVTGAVAAHRTRAAGALIMGAATPSVAAFAQVRAGDATLITVPSPRPQIGVVDIRRRRDPDAAISDAMLDLVRREVRSRGRVLILADRKGFAGSLHCAECGEVPRCPRCGMAMAYERARRRLRCRSCGATSPAPASCARCGGTRLHSFGTGTERVAAVAKKITNAVWRFDSDTVLAAGDLKEPLKAFRGHGGIIVSTVIVLPYLADLDPSLVAVVGADRWLHRPEFRATERALALFRALSMATRRRVLIETSDPTHPVLQAIGGPLRPWYDSEIALREALGFPPFRIVAAVTVTASSEEPIARVIDSMRRDAAPPTEILELEPSPDGAAAVRSQRLVVKAPSRGAVRVLLWPYLVGAAPGSRRVRVAVDVDPLDLA